uniref:Uncharacterized protein n=1 Tax=Sphaerodactylus townsendi TaxID=933632 RepID=A0ACB8EEP0_9SAUR
MMPEHAEMQLTTSCLWKGNFNFSVYFCQLENHRYSYNGRIQRTERSLLWREAGGETRRGLMHPGRLQTRLHFGGSDCGSCSLFPFYFCIPSVQNDAAGLAV